MFHSTSELVFQLYLCKYIHTYIHTLMHLGLQSASSVNKIVLKKFSTKKNQSFICHSE